MTLQSLFLILIIFYHIVALTESRSNQGALSKSVRSIVLIRRIAAKQRVRLE